MKKPAISRLRPGAGLGALAAIALTLCSCSPLFRGKEKSILSRCNSLDIRFAGETTDSLLLSRELKNSLASRFSLVINRNARGDMARSCRLTLDIRETDLMAALEDDGGPREKNRMINLSYRIKIGEDSVVGEISTLETRDSSVFKYSDQLRGKKEDSNRVENLADSIFLDIVRQLP
ncbi:MAG: hypothetical protein LBU15_04450 [Rickettsiales bacterium]|jgi:hypothetical protein|nr:hypothetical protein [Rickettsiales bacterium]